MSGCLNNRKPSARRGKVQLIDASAQSAFGSPCARAWAASAGKSPKTARHEIVRIYARLLNGGGPYDEFSKIFDREDFGYREIRVERPLRLSFQVTAERVEAVKAEKQFLKLGASEQEDLIACLESACRRPPSRTATRSRRRSARR